MSSTVLERIFREEHGRLMGALVSQFGDFELAEDALQEAVLAAMKRKASWQTLGPNELYGWILVAARRKAIDILRRESLGRFKNAQLATRQKAFISDEHITQKVEESIQDERLGLLFTCCHPALGQKAQVALTLHSVMGLRVNEIASALLMKEASVAQILTRVKQKIREAGIPFAKAEVTEIPERIEAVLTVLYLIFNEGYSASQDAQQIRKDLCEEAISLTHVLSELQPNSSEILGLLALMLYHHARVEARLNAEDGLAKLEEQDVELFDKEKIKIATVCLSRSFKIKIGGYYQTQAHIASLHARVHEPTIHWGKVAFLYEQLLKEKKSPVIYLNYAVALEKAGRIEQARQVLFDKQMAEALHSYVYYHAACAAACEEDNNKSAACEHYQQAIALASNLHEKEKLAMALSRLQGADD